MEPNKKFKLVTSKKTRYLLPNILTLGGVCLGISSIKFSIDGNFNLADKIRKDLLDQGIVIEDQQDKTIWKLK